MLGALLYAAGGLELAMLVDAATFAAVAVAALAPGPARAAAPGAEPQRARDGIAYLFRDRTLALVMTVAFGSLLFMSAVWVGELFFVQDVLDRGDVSYGAFLSLWTVGMALGAPLLSPRAPRRRRGHRPARRRRAGAGAGAPGAVAELRLLPRVLVRGRASRTGSRT